MTLERQRAAVGAMLVSRVRACVCVCVCVCVCGSVNQARVRVRLYVVLMLSHGPDDPVDALLIDELLLGGGSRRGHLLHRAQARGE